MLIETIREFNRAVPFKPYEIRMAGGARYVVPHADFALVSPRGHYVIVVDGKDVPHHLSAILIERVAPVRNGKRPSKKKSSAEKSR